MVEMRKEDLLYLVKGVTPNFSVFDDPRVKGNGNWVGEHVDRWDWDVSRLEKLDEPALYKLYVICRNSWRAGG